MAQIFQIGEAEIEIGHQADLEEIKTAYPGKFSGY
jgi:hypothetical protein